MNPSLQSAIASLGIKDMGGFLAEVQKAQKMPIPLDAIVGEILAKTDNATFQQSSSATSGLTYYDLELGAKFVYPVLTPLRNETPRVSGKGGIQAAWRAVTAINTAGLRIGVSGGNRGGVQAVSTKDYTAAYKGIGIETSVDFEAQYAGMGFDDVRAIGAKVGLEAAMLGEEALILGGSCTLGLGITGTPTASNVASTAGTLLAATEYSVICVALSFDGFLNGTVANGIQASINRNNADGSSDTFGGGAAQQSSPGVQTTPSDAVNTHIIAASVPVKKGACGYAWFWGAPGHEVLGAITSINSVLISGNATGTQLAATLPAADWSLNALVFDGLLYQAFVNGSNALITSQPTGTAGTGTPLTGDGAGGIVEIDTALKDRWDNYRLSPDTIWVNSQEAQNLSKKILAGQTNSAQRFVFESEQSALGGGVMVRTYLNKFSMAGPKTLDIRIHPNMPPGTMLLTTRMLPYPMANIANVWQIRFRQDYYQIEWPLRARRYETGVYADEVLQHYFPPSLVVINNIANG
jgi:hypothetical protein